MSNSSIAQNFKAGDKLAGCFSLKEMLPPQGPFVVWLAQDEELNKEIALHFVPDSVAGDAKAMAELKQEAKRNRQLVHPRIVRVHDLLEDEKWAAVSMDRVQGESLASLQKKHDKNAFNPSELAAGIPELCQTLEDAHRIDLFHRDLSPENLISTANGLMVQKFGISRVVLDSLARAGNPAEGQRDVLYISPQQLDSERPNRSDDLYSLGAALYDLLTGAPPFTEGDVIGQIRKTVPPTVSEKRAAKGITGEPVPKAWDETIAACLAKTPDGRPKSAAEAGTRFGSAKAAGVSPIAAAEAATAAAAAAAADAAASAAGAAKPASGQPAQETKQQKRPWISGPGKAPIVTEATVLSKTDVPKAEKAEKTEPKPEGKTEPAREKTADTGAGKKVGGPTTPTGFPLRAFVEVEGDSKPQKGKSNAGLIVAIVAGIVIILAIVVFRNSSNTPENGVAANGTPSAEASPSPEESATPPAAAAESATPAPTPVNMAENNSPSATPETAPEAAASASPAPAGVAESPAPAQLPAATPSADQIAALATLSDSQAQSMLADKAKALDQAKAVLSAAESDAKAKADAQSQAAAAVQQMQATLKQKSDDAAASKKTADDAAATLKQQQDALQKAEDDAAEAQKIAAAKAQAVDQQRKAMQDAQDAAQKVQAEQQQAEAGAADLNKAIADHQKAADDAAKAADDAEKERQQQLAAVSKAQSELAMLQSGLQAAQQTRNTEKARKAAEEAARLQQLRAAETARLATQAAAAEKAAEDARKALEAAQKAVADAERAQKEAEAQAAAAQSGAMPATTPAVENASPAPTATPAASPAATPPSTAAIAPTLSVRGPNPHLKVDQALTNSIGMRFAPVGNVFFSIWLTRVEDFDAFAKAANFKGNAWRNPGFKQAPDHPVVYVSWNDANLFCLWLTEKEHREGILAANETYRLPTDLEWSNAVGLPQESGKYPSDRDMDVPDVYPWGSQWPPPAGAGNYTGEETDSDVAIKGYNDGFAWTSPVGSFTPNKYGLYDMGGNVWEWCLDWWNGEQKHKVLRGASWDNGALKLSLLSSCRIHASPTEGNDDYGFRVVLAQEVTRTGKHHGQAARN